MWKFQPNRFSRSRDFLEKPPWKTLSCSPATTFSGSHFRVPQARELKLSPVTPPHSALIVLKNYPNRLRIARVTAKTRFRFRRRGRKSWFSVISRSTDKISRNKKITHKLEYISYAHPKESSKSVERRRRHLEVTAPKCYKPTLRVSRLQPRGYVQTD